jgi:integrase
MIVCPLIRSVGLKAATVRRPTVPAESPTLGFTRLQFDALLIAARQSPRLYDFALVAMLGLLGLPIFEATGPDITRPQRRTRPPRAARMRQRHQDSPDPAAARGRPGDRPGDRPPRGRPILLSSRGARMDRHAATRRLRHLAQTAGIYVARTHPHMLRHTFVTTTLDAGVDLRDVQIAARHAGPRTSQLPARAIRRRDLDFPAGAANLCRPCIRRARHHNNGWNNHVYAGRLNSALGNDWR